MEAPLTHLSRPVSMRRAALTPTCSAAAQGATGCRRTLWQQTLEQRRLLRGMDPGLHHVAVRRQPLLDALYRIAGSLDVELHLVHLLLGQPDALHQGVGGRVGVVEALVDDAGDPRGWVRLPRAP